MFVSKPHIREYDNISSIASIVLRRLLSNPVKLLQLKGIFFYKDSKRQASEQWKACLWTRIQLCRFQVEGRKKIIRG